MMKAKKRVFAAAIAVTMVTSGWGGSAKAPESTAEALPPAPLPTPNADGSYNIIFITTDQEHYFDQFPEGTGYRARELLARFGTTFEKHYSCSTMSTSSRSVIYTGTHITNTKMIDNTDFDWQGPLSTGIVTVGDLLRRAGYYTAYKGKWHMGDVSLLGAAGDGQTDLGEYGFADWGVDGDYTSTIWEGFERDGEIQSDAIEWLRTTGTEKNSSGISFFLAVNLINPHDIMFFNTDPDFRGTLPVGGPPDDEIYRKTYDTAVPSSWSQNLADGTLPRAVSAYKTRWEGWTGSVTTEEGWKDFRNYYYNCIQDSDNHLLEILQGIADLDMMKNTIIVFTADHGEMGGAHNLKGKGGVIYEENIHVPLVVYHPEFEGGRRISSVTSHLDLAPTFVHMTNIGAAEKAEITAGLRGNNLMELMRNPFGTVRDGALFCFEMISMTMAKAGRDASGNISYTFDLGVRGFVRAIITERYKFARYFSSDFNAPSTFEELLAKNDLELYDLENDPDEMHNLAAHPEANRELILDLNARLNALIAHEIGVDDGAEFRTMLADYLASLDKGTGGCSAGTGIPSAVALLLPLLVLAAGFRRRK
jgi:arylsulfatase